MNSIVSRLKSYFGSFIQDNFVVPPKMSSSEKPRIEFIDLAKGICILLVVAMHSGYTQESPALKAMRMPLYFILSGLFFKDYGGIVPFLHKKVNKLFVPFCSFAMMGLMLAFIGARDFCYLIELMKIPLHRHFMVNYPIWFLLCLLYVNIMFYVINRYITNKYLRLGVIIVIWSIGYLLYMEDVFVPFFFASAFSALPFFYIGYLLKSTPLLYVSKNDRAFLGIGLMCIILAVTYCCLVENPSIDFMHNEYSGNVVEIYLVSIAMVVGILLICKSVMWLPVVSYIGQFSIIVLGLHALVMEYSKLLIFHLTGHELIKLEKLALALFICWICIPLFRAIFPSFTAQSDLFHLPERFKRAR